MKRTIFEGTVNGEKFNTVQAYNARLTELLNAGVAVEASSNTRVEDVEEPVHTSGYVRTCTDDTCDCGDSTITSTHDEDLSYYPYYDEADPYYLDLLVTDDPEINVEARKEMHNIFDKCYSYICKSLYDNEVAIDTKKSYLEDVRDIVAKVKQDSKYNAEALVSIRHQREEAEKRLKAAKEEFEETVRLLDREEAVLNDARPVIDDFTQFYSAIESETLQAIAEHTASNKNDSCPSCGNGNGRCTCRTNQTAAPQTTVTETVPQQMFDLQSLLDRVFGPHRLF